MQTHSRQTIVKLLDIREEVNRKKKIEIKMVYRLNERKGDFNPKGDQTAFGCT